MLPREWDKLISAYLNNGDWSFQSLAWEGPQELINAKYLSVKLLITLSALKKKNPVNFHKGSNLIP